MALSALVSEARIVFGACFLISRASPASGSRSLTRPGRRLHSWIRTLLVHGTAALPVVWKWSLEQCLTLHQHLLCLAAPALPVLDPVDADALPIAGVLWHTPPRHYPAALYAFLHSLRAGLSWAHALDTLAHLPLGHFSADGRVFCVPAVASGACTPDACLPLQAPTDSDALTLFFCGAEVVAICSSHSVLPRPTPAPSAGVRLFPSEAPSRFLPDYIRLKTRKLPSSSAPNSSAPLSSATRMAISGSAACRRPLLSQIRRGTCNLRSRLLPVVGTEPRTTRRPLRP